ncbi:translation initiation factor 2, partial [Actinoplanes sp. NPDC049596]
MLWSGQCAVAEYAFDEPASMPRWTLPEETEVVVTEERVVYRDPVTQSTGELRWPWPQHLRVQPGNRDAGRSATVTQIQLVCAGPHGSFPALVFAGGDLTAVSDADRLANTLRQAIARYRVEHAGELGIPVLQTRMLSRLVIGPEFNNFQGGDGQTVTLIGAVSVQQLAAEPQAPQNPWVAAAYAPPAADTYARPARSSSYGYASTPPVVSGPPAAGSAAVIRP